MFNNKVKNYKLMSNNIAYLREYNNRLLSTNSNANNNSNNNANNNNNDSNANNNNNWYDKTKHNYDRLKDFTIVASLSGVIGYLLLNYSNARGNIKESRKDIKEIFNPTTIANSVESDNLANILNENNEFVNRNGIEKQINDIIDNEKAKFKYHVIYGPKASGKSTIVEKCVLNKKGIIYVSVSTVTDKKDIIESIISKIADVRDYDNTIPINEAKLASIIKETKIKDENKKKIRLPTIVFDVERSANETQAQVVKNVQGIAKELCKVCNVIIILSEANGVIHFSNDSTRTNFIFMEELTIDEAFEYIEKNYKKDISEKELSKLFHTIGTKVGLLNDFVTSNKSIDEFIKYQLSEARSELVKFPLKPILKALKEHPEGVNPEIFNNAKYKDVDLSDTTKVGLVMKPYNVILYDMKKKLYKLQSTDLKTALKDYDPVINPNRFQK